MYGDYELEQDKRQDFYFRTGRNPCRPHFHQKPEILYILEGETEVVINTDSRVLKPGEMAVAGSYDVHSYIGGEYATQFVAIIPIDAMKDYKQFMNNKQLKEHFITDPETALKIYSALFELQNPALHPLTVTGLVNTALGRILETLGTVDEGRDRDTDLMRRILTYIDEHYAENITLETLSNHFCYNLHYFSRMFNDFFKIGISDYLAEVRLRRVIYLISSEKMSVAAAAFSCGFSSLQSFYRHFSKVYNTTPTEFLNAKKEANPD